jgi:hypothetical protein
MQPMGRPKHALKVSSFFLFKFGEGRIFFHFSLVPNVFSLCSFQVPNVFSLCSFQVPNVFSLCSFQVPNEISLGSSNSHCVP